MPKSNKIGRNLPKQSLLQRIPIKHSIKIPLIIIKPTNSGVKTPRRGSKHGNRTKGSDREIDHLSCWARWARWRRAWAEPASSGDPASCPPPPLPLPGSNRVLGNPNPNTIRWSGDRGIGGGRGLRKRERERGGHVESSPSSSAANKAVRGPALSIGRAARRGGSHWVLEATD